jgi:hypothetical protein
VLQVLPALLEHHLLALVLLLVLQVLLARLVLLPEVSMLHLLELVLVQLDQLLVLLGFDYLVRPLICFTPFPFFIHIIKFYPISLKK